MNIYIYIGAVYIDQRILRSCKEFLISQFILNGMISSLKNNRISGLREGNVSCVPKSDLENEVLQFKRWLKINFVEHSSIFFPDMELVFWKKMGSVMCSNATSEKCSIFLLSHSQNKLKNMTSFDKSIRFS